MTDIVFDEPAHEYRIDGRLIPNVTLILADLCDFSHVAPEALEYARLRGTATHKAVELEIAGRLDYATLSPPIAARLLMFAKFMLESGFEVLLSERIVHDALLGFCGKLDLYGVFPDRSRAIIDIKTGVVEPVAGPQTAAYQHALMLEVPEAAAASRFALWLGADRYALKPLGNARDWPQFQNRLIQWKRLNLMTLLSQ